MKKSSYNYSCGALQTYFGVYVNRTEELPERNEYWIRPNSNTRPKGYEKIEWVQFLESLWSSQQTIEDIKKRDKEYLESMERFVDSEYRRFLDAE